MLWCSVRSTTSALRSRPDLWAEALKAAWSFRSEGSLLPSRDLLRWRISTAYGSGTRPVDGVDVVRYLEWRRALILMCGVRS